MFNFEFYNPVKVDFGVGKAQLIGEKVALYGTKALVVSYKNAGFLEDILNQAKARLKESGVESVDFFEIQENPDVADVAKGVEAIKETACDVVLAIGGGSVMDGAKAIAAGFYYESDLWNMVNFSHSGNGDIAPPEKSLPLLTMTTLPATGSEMNMCSVLSNRAIKKKSYIWAECLFPKVSILDPELTYSLPPMQTALAAADTISHVLEVYINSRADTPLQHYWQEGCMRVTMENTQKAMDTPQDEDARGNLMWASTTAINGWAYPGDGWTPIHQVGHTLTSLFGISHGASLTSLMVHWMTYNSVRRPEPYLRFAKRVMDVDAAGKLDADVIAQGIAKFSGFLKSINVPTTISELGVKVSDFDKIISTVKEVSFGADGQLACDPMMSEDDIREVLKLAL